VFEPLDWQEFRKDFAIIYEQLVRQLWVRGFSFLYPSPGAHLQMGTTHSRRERDSPYLHNSIVGK
jgi:hypothetical protein